MEPFRFVEGSLNSYTFLIFAYYVTQPTVAYYLYLNRYRLSGCIEYQLQYERAT